MRWRLCERRTSPYSCCFCCHVRTGTVFIGLFSLLNDLVRIGVTLMLCVHPELLDDTSDHGTDSEKQFGSNRVTDSYVNVTNGSTWSSPTNWNSESRAIELVLHLGAMMFTVSLLYGVIKGVAKFLLPYFCLQIFYFCVNSVIVIGYFTYHPNTRQLVASQKWLPVREQLLLLSNSSLTLFLGLIVVLLLWVKAYFISVVWSCYKYLTYMHTAPERSERAIEVNLQCLGGGLGSTSSLPDISSRTGHNNPADNDILLPPKYEDALQFSDVLIGPPSSPPPPPYSEVRETAPPSS